MTVCYDGPVKAITRLYQSGMNRASVASAIGSPTQLIGLYERDERFPGKEKYCQIVLLAESRGLTLLASDFIEDGACGLGESARKNGNNKKHK